MIRMKRLVKIILFTLLIVAIFALASLGIKFMIIPILPPSLQLTATYLIGSLLTTIAVIAGLSQITGLGIKDIISDGETSTNGNLTQVNGTHEARGEGYITGLDIQDPVILKPGTKSTAEGKGVVTGTRISRKKEGDNEGN